MVRNRKGITLMEIMTVVVMAILMTAIAFPKLKETRRAASMQSARTQVESYLSIARSIAVRNGVRALLIREGNTMRIVADSLNGTFVTVVRPMRLDSLSNVLLTSSAVGTADTIIYDNRGIAVNLAAMRKYYITAASGIGAGTKDSICVTRLGLSLDRKCGQVVTPPEKGEDGGGEIIVDDPIKGGEIEIPPAPEPK